jgi:hypothetical protein
MKRVALCSLVIFVCVAASEVCGQQREPEWPAITGIVVDENDTPVKRAEVCASRHGPSAGPEPCDLSNARGEFSIHVWRSGTYTVWAEQLERGYPDSKSNFYGPGWQSLPQVTIDERSKPDPLRIKFARKAGRLVLTILDGTTNKPIERGEVILSRDQPNSWESRGTGWPKGHYEILTPDGPFTIKFRTWHGEWVDRKAFDESGMQVETIQLDPGARREMTIRLN